MTSLGDALLATPEGIAFLACGATGGRLDEVLDDPGLTLCLAAHAVAEVARGTDGGRIASFVASPGDWLVTAARTVDRADTDWWSTTAHGVVLRCVDRALAGIEVVDARGLRRSCAEEGSAHVGSGDTGMPPPPRRCRFDDDVELLVVDGPDDVDARVCVAVEAVAAGRTGGPAVQLTLRGALTVPRGSLPAWPWPVAGVALAPGTGPHHDEPLGAEPLTVHDYGWPSIGRPVDPRLDDSAA